MRLAAGLRAACAAPKTPVRHGAPPATANARAPPAQPGFLQRRRVAAASGAPDRAASGAGASASSPPPPAQEQEEERFYDYRGHRVRYFSASPPGGGGAAPAALLIHGFGVGGYHFAKNMAALAAAGFRVFAVDLLGQGASWPDPAGAPPGAGQPPLYYSIDTWTAQLRDFIVDVIHGGEPGGQKTYVMGNSLGGFLAASLAAAAPELCAGVLMLNATPFWAFAPPLTGRPRGIWDLLPDGAVPGGVPDWITRLIGRLWWDALRAPASVRGILRLVYAFPDSVDDALVERIIEARARARPCLGFDSAARARLSRMPLAAATHHALA